MQLLYVLTHQALLLMNEQSDGCAHLCVKDLALHANVPALLAQLGS